MLKRVLQIGAPKDALVLDFFAGSATTFHAALEQNVEDGGSRRCILVQLPEPLEEKTSRGYLSIADITRDRMRRAGARIKSDKPTTTVDVGFRCYRLDVSNITAWSPKSADLKATLFDHAEHIAEGRTASDVLHELLLKLGLDLCVPALTKTIAGKNVQSVAGGVLITCLEPSIGVDEVEAVAQGIVAWRKELAPAGDTTCVFRDSAFADDVAKTNMAAILQQHGIANVRSL